LIQTDERAGTVIFVGGRRPEAAIEQEMEARGVRVQWARSIRTAAGLLNPRLERTVVITELALVDGNWRDLIERVRCDGRLIPIVLLASASTADLWWDALDCGVEDILIAPLSASRLCEFLGTRFTIPD
jgi:DNA-binding NtrC family response regulator